MTTTIMTTVFEKSDEWGGVTIKEGATGFIIEYNTHTEGEIDGLKVLVPYGTWGFEAKTDLEAAHDDTATNGEALCEKAFSDATKPIADRRVEVLDEGAVLDPSKRKKRSEPVFAGAPLKEDARHDRVIERESSWYTFSLPKEDEEGYGKCHDLFTEMYLTHTMPYGMALWTKSNYDTDENMFFAEIPQGMNVRDDQFFRAFPLAECAQPRRTGLSMLVGHQDEPPKPKLPEKRRRFWRRSEVHL